MRIKLKELRHAFLFNIEQIQGHKLKQINKWNFAPLEKCSDKWTNKLSTLFAYESVTTQCILFGLLPITIVYIKTLKKRIKPNEEINYLRTPGQPTKRQFDLVKSAYNSYFMRNISMLSFVPPAHQLKLEWLKSML